VRLTFIFGGIISQRCEKFGIFGKLKKAVACSVFFFFLTKKSVFKGILCVTKKRIKLFLFVIASNGW
jgi:hypothetical protein